MIITPSEVYWITRLDTINETLEIASVFSMIFVAIFTLAIFLAIVLMTMSHDIPSEYEEMVKFMKFSIKGLIISSLIGLPIIISKILLPTTAEMVAIKLIPAINNSEFVQEQLPKEAGELYEILKKSLLKKLESNKK